MFFIPHPALWWCVFSYLCRNFTRLQSKCFSEDETHCIHHFSGPAAYIVILSVLSKHCWNQWDLSMPWLTCAIDFTECGRCNFPSSGGLSFETLKHPIFHWWKWGGGGVYCGLNNHLVSLGTSPMFAPSLSWKLTASGMTEKEGNFSISQLFRPIIFAPVLAPLR